MRKSIIFLQNEIMQYRKPLFNELSKYYDLTVLHAGTRTRTGADFYKEIILEKKELGPFCFTSLISILTAIRKCDYVVAMFDLRWPTFLIPMAISRSKYILWGHRYSENMLANKIRDILMSKARKIILYGDEELELMSRRGVDISKVSIAWNTVHVANSKDYSSFEKNSFLFVGRLQPLKRIDDLIKCFARNYNMLPKNTVLNIVGDPAREFPAYMDELKQLSDSLGIRHAVVFHGKNDDEGALARLFSLAFAYVSPGPVGLGVLHSLAYGVPVITIKTGRHGPEYHNIIDRENGLICETIDCLSESLTEIIENDLYRELGHNAFKQYQSKRQIDNMIDGFCKAIG